MNLGAAIELVSMPKPKQKTNFVPLPPLDSEETEESKNDLLDAQLFEDKALGKSHLFVRSLNLTVWLPARLCGRLFGQARPGAPRT